MNVLGAALRELSIRSRFTERIEKRVARLFSISGARNVKCHATGRSMVPREGQNWFSFRDTGGHEFSLCFAKDEEQGTKVGYFVQLVEFMDGLSGGGSECSDLFVKETYASPEALVAQEFQLQLECGAQRLLWYKENSEREISFDGDEVDSMNDKIDLEEQIPAELTLGVLGINCQDLLDLRPGTSVQFPCPESFQGALKVDGQNLAQLQLKIIDGRIYLEIQGNGHDSNIIPTQQETFAQKSRLINEE